MKPEKLLFVAAVLFGLTSCTSFIQSLREESAAVDQEYDRGLGEGLEGDDLPRSMRGVSANNVSSYDPPVTRGYGRRLEKYVNEGEGAVEAAEGEYRRATRQDFIDKESAENSLWDGQGQNNFLFTNNARREPGDLITADVEKDLRREIQYQLWMTLPAEQRKAKRTLASTADDAKKAVADPTGAAKAAEDKAKDQAEEAAKTNMAPEGKDDDVIRMEVAETLGNGLVRVVGQKRVIYRGASRVLEVMALVNNKDVDPNNRVKSSAFLDVRTQVIQ